jgi:hypothetical protein
MAPTPNVYSSWLGRSSPTLRLSEAAAVQGSRPGRRSRPTVTKPASD